jgi:glycerol kinase
MSVLVVDVGTTDVRVSVVRSDGSIDCAHRREVLATSLAPGLSEFDAVALAAAVLETARAALAQAGAVDGIGIACQRASTIVWDRSTGEPVGPGLGWQDVRTAGTCLELHGRGIHLNPSQSATKVAYLLDAADPERRRNLCWGTVDTWVAWTLSEGGLLVEDATNAAVTGLVTVDGSQWDEQVRDALRINSGACPCIVDISGTVGRATALLGDPPIAGIVGDQQASLVGPALPRSPSAREACSTCVSGRVAHPSRIGASTAPSPSWPGAGRDERPGVSRRRCSRPAPAWSG